MFSVAPKDTLRPIYTAIFIAEYCSSVPMCYEVSFKIWLFYYSDLGWYIVHTYMCDRTCNEHKLY